MEDISPAALEAMRLADHFGAYVFPIQPRSKIPLADKSWKDISTNDPTKIQEIAAHPLYRSCNWALDCEKSGMCVLDVDKKGEKNGFDTLDALYPEPTTGLIAQTPSGGSHFIFYGKIRNSVENKLGPGLDTRGQGGYIVLPGSLSAEGIPYSWVSFGIPGKVPSWIVQGVGRPRAERSPAVQTPITEEKEHHVQTAIRYLEEEAPEAIEGSGGDRTTYEIGCRLRDLGVSEDTAFSLLLGHWNSSKAHPPWHPNDLRTKVRNAYRYAQDRPGNSTPEAIFGTAIPDFGEWKSAASITAASLKPRDWVLGRRYMAGAVTVTVADGGVGKSLLSYVEGLSVASGRQLTHDKVVKKGRVLLFNAEEPSDEIDRRIYAARLFHNLSDEESVDLAIKSGAGQNWRLLLQHGRELAVKKELVDFFTNEIIRHKAVLFLADPMVRLHSTGENDSTSMDMLVEIFVAVATKTNAAIGLIHHTNKEASSPDSMKAARGSSAIVAGARTGRVVTKMSKAEGIMFGVPPQRVPWYFQVTTPKGNYSPPGSPPQWYELQSVVTNFIEGVSGDDIETSPTIKPVTFDRVFEGETPEEAALREEVINIVTPSSPTTVYSLAKEIAKETGQAFKTVRAKIVQLFEEPYQRSGLIWSLRSVSQPNTSPGERPKATIVCTIEPKKEMEVLQWSS